MEPPPTPQPAGTPPSTGPPPLTTDAPESKKRARQPRNSACSACAGLKMKCVRAEEGGACERCNRMRVQCIPAVPKPRKRREGEFIAAHSFGSLPDYSTESTPVKQSAALPMTLKPAQEIVSGPKAAILSRSDLHYQDSKSFTAILSQGLGLEHSQTPSELLRGIDANVLVNACTIFRQYSSHFPFTSIPMRVDGVSMASRRPMTALAVCTVAAAADPDRQERLSHAFRSSLAAKAVVQGDRSVDILAGLLIYLAWNHHYMSKQQIYQYLSLLPGMSADLGLYDKPPRRDINDRNAATELDRCFVGAYFLCSLLPPFAFGKPCPMRWTDYLRTSAENVMQAGELQSDRSLSSLLELAAAIDDFQSALQVACDDPTSHQYRELQARAASQRLRALRRDHGFLAGNMILSACSIDIQQQQIQSKDSPDSSTMIQCACSAKEYFDDLLSRPAYFLHQATIVDWVLMMHVAVLMFRLAKQAAIATGWEHGALTSMLHPEQTLSRLLNHMAAVPADDPLLLKHDGLLRWLDQFVHNNKESALLDNQPEAARNINLSEGRFRPVNSEAVSLSNQPLPYHLQEPAAERRSVGVLDPEFWRPSATGG